jgi:hypothetical protein
MCPSISSTEQKDSPIAQMAMTKTTSAVVVLRSRDTDQRPHSSRTPINLNAPLNQ